jgi:hypothetical protein
MIQKVKDKTWTDESGASVPINYISAVSRMKERNAETLLREAKIVNKKLVEYKAKMEKLCHEVYVKAMEEYKASKEGKGNFTWFNFDRSIRVEVSIQERVVFDDLAIKASKEKLDAFLNESLDSKTAFIKDMVIEAFSTSRGRIDSKKVMQLIKYRTKISHPLFQDAINILSDGILRPDTKTYFRIWERASDGQYEIIELNFSAL